MRPPTDGVPARVVHSVSEVLGVPGSEIGIDTRAADIEAWDSFGHVRIVLALEAEFGLQFSMAEIEAADSIAGLVRIVESSTSASDSRDEDQ